ncbi:hypothetical protein Hdeb2414_s0010g00337721 [Helianthus debilis subsp. tardiflorus]
MVSRCWSSLACVNLRSKTRWWLVMGVEGGGWWLLVGDGVRVVVGDKYCGG